jgi:putative hydrolase of the HAD superfamily
MATETTLRDIQAVLFDWGGTLCDLARELNTIVECAESAVARCAKDGLALPPDAVDRLMAMPLERRALTGAPPEYWEYRERDMVREWLERVGVSAVTEDLVDRVSAAFWAPWVHCLDLYDGVPEMLDTLRDRGYVLGLLSNVAAPPECCDRQLRRLGLEKRLDFAEFSSRLGRRKPHPSVYEATLGHVRRLRPQIRPGQVLFVGDSPEPDVIGPARAGMRTALVHTQEVPSGGRPDLHLERIAELPDHLPAHRNDPRGTT